jgi:hypothetical protein
MSTEAVWIAQTISAKFSAENDMTGDVVLPIKRVAHTLPYSLKAVNP